MTKGIIFNIQRYSLNDGPGIRTTVFFKGCPLTCWWCHNPESQPYGLRLMFYHDRCLHCNLCKDICENPEKCIFCGKCAEVCPAEALQVVGREITVRELSQEILKDRMFYEESGGGVTFSGGEPLTQDKFLVEMLKNCHRHGIHTVVDTSGYADLEVVKRVAEHTDLWLFDLKHMNQEEHKQLTGVSNTIILKNLKQLAYSNKKIKVRVPIIPTCNDSNNNIISLGEFLSSIPNLINISILPYHNLAEDKHQRFLIKYRLKSLPEPTEEQMLRIKHKLEKFGLNVQIGG